MSKAKREREDQALLLLMIEDTTGHPFGCRPPASPARARLQRRGLIVRTREPNRKAGNPNRWWVLPAGRALATTLNGAS